MAFMGVLLAGCATAPPSPAGAASDDAEAVAAPTPASLAPGLREEIAFVALSLLGKPYAAGGLSPESGFDCSGLVAYVFRQASRLNLPRNTYEQSRVGDTVPRSALEPGDLVFYNTQSRDFSHVGIYLGESRFIHAPASGGFVRIENMRATYWTTRYNGARRIAP